MNLSASTALGFLFSALAISIAGAASAVALSPADKPASAVTAAPGSHSSGTAGTRVPPTLGNPARGRYGLAPVGPKVDASDAEWRKKLSSEQYRILRAHGTERAFSGKYWDDHVPGLFLCAGCGNELFSSADKFDSGTGWPSYTRPVVSDRIGTHEDKSMFMARIEVHCARCGGHLGHVFDDGPEPTGLRYCINGNALEKKPLPADK